MLFVRNRRKDVYGNYCHVRGFKGKWLISSDAKHLFTFHKIVSLAIIYIVHIFHSHILLILTLQQCDFYIPVRDTEKENNR